MRSIFFANDEDADVRIHGNGFLQAELTDGRKMHVWERDCPVKQDVSTQIHDHTSSFTSEIIMGMLWNIEYTILPVCFESNVLFPDRPQFKVYEARVRHDKDTGLYDTGERVITSPTYRNMFFNAGSSYDFPRGQYHSTEPIGEYVVTFVTRRDDDNGESPRILVPEGQEPDNDFDRYAHHDYAIDLYQRIKRLIP